MAVPIRVIAEVVLSHRQKNFPLRKRNVPVDREGVKDYQVPIRRVLASPAISIFAGEFEYGCWVIDAFYSSSKSENGTHPIILIPMLILRRAAGARAA